MTKTKRTDAPDFGVNQGVWEYYDVNDNFLGYVVRKQRGEKKYFTPWTFQNNEWKCEWWPSADGRKLKPIYRAQFLKKEPNKPVLIVEGEKTTDRAQELLPNYCVISWMGGAAAIKAVDFNALKGRKVYLWPDNDDAGKSAMIKIQQSLKGIADEVILVNIEGLGLPEKWDLGDFDSEFGEIDQEMIFITLQDSKPKSIPFDVLSYPFLGGTAKRPITCDVRENLEHLLDHFSITVRWNMMRRVREINVPDVKFFAEEHENDSLHFITDLAVKYNFPYRRINEHLDKIAWDNAYHPVRDWILSVPKPNASYLDEFIGLLKTTNPELTKILLRKWMISAIEAVFSETGFAAQGVLVIQGEQGTHKTTFIKSLVDPLLNAVKTGQLLDPSNKDSVLESSNYWLVELGELDATFRKADIARLKAHITRDMDELRRAYARKSSHMARRTVFAATVNESRFFVDETGNRRWWVVSLTESINTRHGFDMQAIWREVYELWQAGENSELSKDTLALLNSENEQYLFIDPFEEKIISRFNQERPNAQWMTTSEILESIGYEHPTKADATRASAKIKKLGFQQGEGRRRRHFIMPEFNQMASPDQYPKEW